MKRQRTFELIPTTLVHPNGNKPPMTSKQVKREYLKANQKDRLTRAEQRQLEAKELRRLKLEILKEKASAKARTTKENKISKALVEAQLRKKAGLPPKPTRSRSQTTISFFTGCDCPTVIERQKVKTKADKDSGPYEKQTDEEGKEDVKQYIMKELSTKKDTHDSESSEDEFGGFPFCSQLEMMVTSIDSKKRSPITQIPNILEPELSKLDSQILDLQPNLPKNKINEDSQTNVLQDSPRSVLTIKHALEASYESSKQDVEILNPQTQACKCSELSIEPVSPADLCDSSSTTVENHLNFPQSLLPVKDRTLLSYEMTQLQELPCPDVDITILRTTPEDNKTSVVDLEFSNEFLEDFLSSPTQEIEDLHDDDDDIDDIDAADFPSNTQIMTEINSSISTRSENHHPKVSPEIQVTKLKNNHSAGLLVKTAENLCTEAGPQATIKQQDYFDDFICTQDLVVLSQELMEVNAPIPDKFKAEHRSTQEKVKEKKRFFEEKEEDLVKAALYESKMMASKSNSSRSIRQDLELSIDTITYPSDHCTTTTTTSFLSSSSPGTDYGADDFAVNEWEELSALCEPKFS
ncbi:hypothetical protein OnM2_003013 [Erysiphe neolycopersici]|uniref:Uncharacterized protein n=1 Tax=Erysiphe neolycopersici TaxID=212602 RepID=A0A420I7Y2_9PEZI|nr:hypothetical protein OnM2_003013 [Erysiphe neolycopersici]